MVRSVFISCLLGFCASPAVSSTAIIYELESPANYGFLSLRTMAHNGLTGYGTVRDLDFEEVAFRWTGATGIEILGDAFPDGRFPGEVSIVDTTADGSLVIGTSVSDKFFAEPFIWEDSQDLRFPEGPTPLPFLTQINAAEAISGDGSTVLLSRNFSDYWRWDTQSGEVTPLASQVSFLTEGHALGSKKTLSHDGTVLVGGINTPSGDQMAVTIDGDNDPRVIGPNDSMALLVTPDGTDVIGVTGDAVFTWSELEGYEEIGGIGYGETIPTGVTDDGSLIVGYYRDADRRLDYFVWTEDYGMLDTADYFKRVHGLDLEAQGRGDLSVVNVSGDGRVFAWGQGVIAVVPEPTSFLLLVSSLTPLLSNARRRWVAGVAAKRSPQRITNAASAC